MHRFFLEQNLAVGDAHITNAELLHQLQHVLKIKPGSEIILFSGGEQGVAGWDFLFRVSRISKSGVDGVITEKIKNDREPKFSLTLYQSILKKDKMEWIFEKGTEVGIAQFVPVVTERSVKTRINMIRAQKICRETTEQSGRAIPPMIDPIVNFQTALSMAKAEGVLVLVHEKESVQKLDNLPLSSQKVNLFVGPEGGFSESEVYQAEAAGCFIASLSRRVLRAETAAIAASYYILHRFGY